VNFVIIQLLLIFLLIGKEFPLDDLFFGFFTPCNKSYKRCRSRLRKKYRKVSSFFQRLIRSNEDGTTKKD